MGIPGIPRIPSHPSIAGGGGVNFTDTFTRGNETFTGDWTILSGGVGGVVSNTARFVSGANVFAALVRAASVSDYFVQAVVTYLVANGIAVGARFVAGVDGYIAYFNESGSGGYIRVFRLDDGSLTLLGTSSTGLANPGTIKISVSGSTIKAFHDGVEVISVTDSTYSAAGSPGMWLTDDAGGIPYADNFETSGVLV